MADNLHTWIEEREAIREIRNILVKIPDAYYGFPKLLAGVKAVLDVLDAGVRDGDDAETIRNVALMELQEAINDDE